MGLSLSFAVLHAILEVIVMRLEARACKTTLIHYAIVCFNARFDWVPFITSIGDPEAARITEIMDFDCIRAYICSFRGRIITFEFN